MIVIAGVLILAFADAGHILPGFVVPKNSMAKSAVF